MNGQLTQPPRPPEAEPLDGPEGYFSTGEDGLLPWPWAEERLTRARYYWLATARPDGRPHVAPLWGVWVGHALYFDGSPATRWARNLTANPAAAINLESGDEVVIAEGRVSRLRTEPDVAAAIIEAWNEKYGRLEPEPSASGIYRVQPDSVRGWSNEALERGTRWRYAAR